jgi:hypothetical protein
MRTRVLLVGMPKLLRDLVKEILMSQSDITVVGELTELDARLIASLDNSRAAAVIVGSSQAEVPEVFCRLLRERPSVRVLAIADDGRQTYLYLPLGELSPTGLLDAVRRDG